MLPEPNDEEMSFGGGDGPAKLLLAFSTCLSETWQTGHEFLDDPGDLVREVRPDDFNVICKSLLGARVLHHLVGPVFGMPPFTAMRIG